LAGSIGYSWVLQVSRSIGFILHIGSAVLLLHVQSGMQTIGLWITASES